MHKVDTSITQALKGLGFKLEELNFRCEKDQDCCFSIIYELPLGLKSRGIGYTTKDYLSEHIVQIASSLRDKYDWCEFILIISGASRGHGMPPLPNNVYAIPHEELVGVSAKVYCDEVPLFNSKSQYVEPTIINEETPYSYSHALEIIQKFSVVLIHGKAGIGKTRFIAEATKSQPRLYLNVEHFRFDRNIKNSIQEFVLSKAGYTEHKLTIVFDALEQNTFIRELGLNSFLTILYDISRDNNWDIVLLMRSDWFGCQRISESVAENCGILEILAFNDAQREKYIVKNLKVSPALVSNSELFRIPLMLEFASVAPSVDEFSNEFDIVNYFYLSVLEKKG